MMDSCLGHNKSLTRHYESRDMARYYRNGGVSSPLGGAFSLPIGSNRQAFFPLAPHARPARPGGGGRRLDTV